MNTLSERSQTQKYIYILYETIQLKYKMSRTNLGWIKLELGNLGVGV